MNNFQQNFKQNINRQPDSIAISNAEQLISYAQLADEIENINNLLAINEIRRLAIGITNSPAYVCLDLAAVLNKIISIAIPHFFSQEQIEHLLNNAQADAVIVDSMINCTDSYYNKSIQSIQEIRIFGKPHWLLKLDPDRQQKPLPADTLKISYTSGSTGQPKGAIICGTEVDKVITSLMLRLNATPDDRHISVLPFSLLLENIAGIYTVLAAGGQCIVPLMAELGFSGSSSLDISKFINAVVEYCPTTMITVPALAQAFVMGTEQLESKFKSLRFIAVGGAPLSESIISKARQIGLPLYEGYGLTESCSVVSLNTQADNKTGSVGKPLDHIDVCISDEGEIIVSGALCAGYIDNNTEQQQNTWATGDLGYIDADGYLYITGRKRTSYCTAYGRNVSPEWVESELVAHPEISQAVIFGEARHFNIALIVAIDPISNDEINLAITTTNNQLPDYAQVSQWFKADEPFSVTNGQLSMNGIINRSQIINNYQNKIDSFYQ